MGLDVHLIEAGDDVGGTWYWNRYPGARCDVMSIDYSYSFREIQQELRGASSRGAARILSYRASRRQARSERDISFETRATRFIMRRSRALAHRNRRADRSSELLLMATGPLSVPKQVDIPGGDRFKGGLYLSGNRPHHESI